MNQFPPNLPPLLTDGSKPNVPTPGWRGFAHPENKKRVLADQNMTINPANFAQTEMSVCALHTRNDAIKAHLEEIKEWLPTLRSATVGEFEEKIRPVLESKDISPLSKAKQAAAQFLMQQLYQDLGIKSPISEAARTQG